MVGLQLARSATKRRFSSAYGWSGGDCHKITTGIERRSRYHQPAYLPHDTNPYNEQVTQNDVKKATKFACLEYE